MVTKPVVSFTPGTPGNVNSKFWVDYEQGVTNTFRGRRPCFWWRNIDITSGFNGFTPDRLKITPSVGDPFYIVAATSGQNQFVTAESAVDQFPMYFDQAVTWTIRAYNTSTLQVGPVQDTFTSYFQEKNLLRFGPNLCMGVTPAFSGTTVTNSGNLNDGDISDSMSFNAGSNSFNTVTTTITYDLERVTQVDGWMVRFPAGTPVDVATWLEYSTDNVNWLIADMNGAANTSTGKTFRILAPSRKPSGGARYWRFRFNGIVGANNTQAILTAELRQMAPGCEPLGDDVTALGTPISGGVASGSAAANAFDFDMTTYFQASQASGSILANAYIGLDFGANSANWQAISEVIVRQHDATTSAQYNTSLAVEYSDNGAAWTQLGATSAAWASPKSRSKEHVFQTLNLIAGNFPQGNTHRYWRVRPMTTEPTIAWRVYHVQMLTRNFAEFLTPAI